MHEIKTTNHVTITTNHHKSMTTHAWFVMDIHIALIIISNTHNQVKDRITLNNDI